ncbi:MAG TPA: carboxypeptidase-like regulatory domain-containing protein, partial [Pyrinomonadaceae bacterium]|nr:carboxypeptidase-like regulatory domain-containing protein [Pyrinomonadaceae bacterium]
MKNRLSKFALLFFTFSVFGAIDGFAQEDSCALKLELENLVGGVPVKNAQATAINTENKQVYRSVLKDGNPSFAELPEGTYDITVTKAGFKQTKESYLHRCANDEEGVSSL